MDKYIFQLGQIHGVFRQRHLIFWKDTLCKIFEFAKALLEDSSAISVVFVTNKKSICNSLTYFGWYRSKIRVSCRVMIIVQLFLKEIFGFLTFVRVSSFFQFSTSGQLHSYFLTSSTRLLHYSGKWCNLFPLCTLASKIMAHRRLYKIHLINIDAVKHYSKHYYGWTEKNNFSLDKISLFLILFNYLLHFAHFWCLPSVNSPKTLNWDCR